MSENVKNNRNNGNNGEKKVYPYLWKPVTDKDIEEILGVKIPQLHKAHGTVKRMVKLEENEENEEQKRKVEQSPGKIIDRHVIEQANENLYYVYSLDKRGFAVPENVNKTWSTFATSDIVYVPLSRLLWRPLPMMNLAFEYDFTNIAILYNEVRRFLFDHVDFTNDIEYDLCAAWVLHTWRLENFTVTPYIFFYGPAKSGKTRAMEALGALSFRSVLANFSSAGLYHITEQWKPTIFLDEAEVYLRGNDQGDILNFLNMGYRRGQYAIRMRENMKTGRFEPEPFDVFGAKVLAGTKNLLATLYSRCFPIIMTRATRDLKRSIDYEWADEIRAKLVMYRFLSLADGSEPVSIPDDFLSIVKDGRLRELLYPLYVVAPENVKLVFINYASQLDAESEREDELSVESYVYNALISVRKDRNLVPLSEIADVVNVSLKESLGNKTVASALNRLGFHKILVRNRVHIVWNEQLAERLSKRYPKREMMEDIKDDFKGEEIKDSYKS